MNPSSAVQRVGAVRPARRVSRRRGAGRGRPTGLELALLGMLSVLGGCGDATGPSEDRIRIEVPRSFETFYAVIENCSQIEGDFAGISWYVTPRFPDGAGILGRWNSRREITLRMDSWLDNGVVGHEMLHDLLRGDPDHASPAWGWCNLPVGSDG